MWQLIGYSRRPDVKFDFETPNTAFRCKDGIDVNATETIIGNSDPCPAPIRQRFFHELGPVSLRLDEVGNLAIACQ
jgi:hypothetical protein